MRYRLAKLDVDGAWVPLEEGEYTGDLFALLAAREDLEPGVILYTEDLYWRKTASWWEGPLWPMDPSLDGLYAKFVEFSKAQPRREW